MNRSDDIPELNPIDRCASAVQPDCWQDALPRPIYQLLPKIQIPGNDWYDVYQVLPGVYAIYEPGHFQEVISFLIVGETGALLWDTGMGIAPIRPVVMALTALPLTVVNSHCHFDHVGGNWEFPLVYAYPDPVAAKRAYEGYPESMMTPMLGPESLSKPLPAHFDAAAYRIRPWRMAPLQPAHCFDLGGWYLHVLHTPGHTDDSIMLWDRERQVLFTGDTVYPAALYAHYGSEAYGYSRVNVYAHTMNRLAEMAPFLKVLCCSHNLPLVTPLILPQIRDAFITMQKGEAHGRIDSEGLLRFDFEDFAIITASK
jgi:glyoxylase-like metal-dependent hydrolase (beta-lactamase superfamily II)